MNVVGLLKLVVKIEWVDSNGVLKHVFFWTAEQAYRAQRPLPRASNPSGNLQRVFGHQGWRGARPFRLVRQFDFNPRGNDLLHVIFQELFAVGFILVALLNSSPLRLKTRERNRELAL